MKKVISLGLTLIAAVCLLTACIQITPVDSKYLTWTKEVWSAADDQEKEKCAAACLVYLADLAEEENPLTTLVLEAIAPEIVPELNSIFLDSELSKIKTVKDFAEYTYLISFSEEGDKVLSEFLEQDAAAGYLSWTQKEWNAADDSGKENCAAAYLIYLSTLTDPDSVKDEESLALTQKSCIYLADEMISSLDSWFDNMSEYGMTVKEIAKYVNSQQGLY